jgi:uncharacterized protein with HEPN domain
MPFDLKATRRWLNDIRHHIAMTQIFMGVMSYDAFCNDLRTTYAVTRCLEIISEASRRLPDELKARHPSIAWKNMAGAGNVYYQDYEDVADVFRLGRFGGSSSTAAPCRGTGTRGFG